MMMLPAEFTDNPVWLPVLETPRLVIRPFLLQDLADAYRILDVETAQEPRTLAERETWLRWTIAGYTEYARLAAIPLWRPGGHPARERRPGGYRRICPLPGFL